MRYDLIQRTSRFFTAYRLTHKYFHKQHRRLGSHAYRGRGWGESSPRSTELHLLLENTTRWKLRIEAYVDLMRFNLQDRCECAICVCPRPFVLVQNMIESASSDRYYPGSALGHCPHASQLWTEDMTRASLATGHLSSPFCSPDIVQYTRPLHAPLLYLNTCHRVNHTFLIIRVICSVSPLCSPRGNCITSDLFVPLFAICAAFSE